jgi:chromosome transmission fidelity protein 18
LDTLALFETAEAAAAPARYAVRQVMDQEFAKFKIRQAADARQARWRAGGDDDETITTTIVSPEQENVVVDMEKVKVKKDFFGRVIVVDKTNATGKKAPAKREDRIWVAFKEGYSNAVRKPIGLRELLSGL